MVWSALPATGVQLRTVLMHSHTAHMPQPTMCSPVANSQQVAKLACIMLRNVTPGWIQTLDLDFSVFLTWPLI
jgi:hypothetical protein